MCGLEANNGSLPIIFERSLAFNPRCHNRTIFNDVPQVVTGGLKEEFSRISAFGAARKKCG